MTWKFDNSYIYLPEKLFSKQKPSAVREPKMEVFNYALAEGLGLKNVDLENEVETFAGNRIPQGANPIAQAYAGHQFGYFTMLGDGRAILLGEHMTPSGERFDIQLKGSGLTPYSRGGDGRAALGPMLREYIISEAMYALGIPTTRSLAVVSTGEPVYRETVLPGAILTRVAASHIRVGTFQYIYHYGNVEELKLLADYTIQRHFSDLIADEEVYLKFLREVIRRQAQLISKWQLVGFIHGVMNTDNMVLSGETIDYGPCAFMDIYNPDTVFSSIDRYGRYAYGNQPMIAAWNLARFAETLVPLLDPDTEEAVKIANNEVASFERRYRQYYLNGMRDKLGLFGQEQEDEDLINELLSIMERNKADYTNTFRDLTLSCLDQKAFYKTEEFKDWHEKWYKRKSKENKSKQEVNELMRANNPSVIPRNHRVEEALEAAVRGDYSLMEKLLKVLSQPFSYSPEDEEYQLVPESKIPYRTFCGT